MLFIKWNIFPTHVFQQLSVLSDKPINQIVTDKSRVIQVVNIDLLVQQCRMQDRETA